MAEPQPWTTVPARLRWQQQTALGTSVRNAGLKTQEGQSHTGSGADAYLQFPLRHTERVTLCNTWAREIKKGTNLLAYFFSCGIKYGQFKLPFLSAQYRAGKPFHLCASKFSGAFL